MRRQERGVGFYQQPVQGHAGGQPTQIVRLFEGDGAGKAQIETEVEGGYGRFPIARKGVQHACPFFTGQRRLAQHLYQIGARFPVVENGGQLQLGRQLQLHGQCPLLDCFRRPVPVIVEADFANGHHLLMPRQIAQGTNPAILPFGRGVGMNAHGRINRVILLGQGHHRRTILNVGGRNHNLRHSGRQRPRHHLIPVRVKAVKVKVAVGVYESDVWLSQVHD